MRMFSLSLQNIMEYKVISAVHSQSHLQAQLVFKVFVFNSSHVHLHRSSVYLHTCISGALSFLSPLWKNKDLPQLHGLLLPFFSMFIKFLFFVVLLATFVTLNNIAKLLGLHSIW